ncbi:hypothetical protein Slin15195_G122370 [Septoria linicola]|uniref:DUF7730 domain-containing protein n=1 Tax=Septoria linicola TaxID=215465 RepID=A0A9Q9B7P0_9PEZI|nr:hypothetical protein Slin15195_G122370 [Septoria linicola]
MSIDGSPQAMPELSRLNTASLELFAEPTTTQLRNNTTGTNFLSLPAELKNTIYELTLRHHRSIFIGKRGQTTAKKKRLDRARPELTCGRDSDSLHKTKIHMHITVALLLANKQIHEEATSILYGGNSFFFSDHPLLHTWAQQIGIPFGQLREIEIAVDAWMQVPAPREYPVRVSHLKHLTLSVSALRLVGAKCVAKHLSYFLPYGGSADERCAIEIVEEPCSN